jgi:hypothetical protein
MTLTGIASNCECQCQWLVLPYVVSKDPKGGWTYAKVLEQVLGLGVDIELARLGVLGEVESGDLRNVLILALTLLLLKLEGDTADRSTLNTLHKMGGVTSNLPFMLVRDRSSITTCL